MPKAIETDDDEAVVGMRLVKAPTFELDPDKTYVIMFDRRSLTKADQDAIRVNLAQLGIKGITVMLTGDPGTVRIIEQEAKAKRA